MLAMVGEAATIKTSRNDRREARHWSIRRGETAAFKVGMFFAIAKKVPKIK